MHVVSTLNAQDLSLTLSRSVRKRGLHLNWCLKLHPLPPRHQQIINTGLLEMFENTIGHHHIRLNKFHHHVRQLMRKQRVQR